MKKLVNLDIKYPIIKKRFLKIFPYFATLIIGIFFYYLATLKVGLADLFINIAATFFAVPLLYIFYETAQSFSHKRLNTEIFEYAKMQIDSELLIIINQLRKIVYTLEEKDFTLKSINIFLSLKNEDIEKQLITNKYLGFQVFKNWEISEKSLHDLLKNPFILEKMEDEQIISIINILKSLIRLESIQKIDQLYIETNEITKDYKIQSGANLNPKNQNFPDRHMLLKHIDKDRFIVYDFWDIPKYNIDKCLHYYKINDQLTIQYTKIITDLLSDINIWLDITGLEFILDDKHFR